MLMTLVVIAFTWGFLGSHNTHVPPAASAPPCTVDVNGTTADIVCSGVKVATVELPTVRVTQTVPPLPEATRIIKVPGPTQTVTVSPNPVVVTKPPVPRPTVTMQPQPTSLPTPTSETTPRQPTPTHDTIGPATPLSHPHLIDLDDGHTTVIEATLGLLATLLLIAGFFATLYAGYWLGFREADSRNASFMQAVLDKANTNRQESN